MNAIEIRDLEKHYPGFTLDRVNLTLPSGCILGLVGENGAGKSTTIRLILNMMKILNLALLVQHRLTVYRARFQTNHLLEQL